MLPFACASVNHEPVCGLLDSGSSTTFLSHEWYTKHKNICKFKQYEDSTNKYLAANGQLLSVAGQLKVNCRIGDFSWPVTVVIVKGLSVDLVFGCDFFSKTGLRLDYCTKSFSFNFAPGRVIPFCKCKADSGVRTVIKQDGGFDLAHLSEHEARQVRTMLDQFPHVLTDRLGVTDKLTYKIELTDHTPLKQSPYRLPPPPQDESLAC